MNMNFLKKATLIEAKQSISKGGTAKTKFPENGADLRVFASGAIYPSAELVKEFGLEYVPTVLEQNKAVKPGNGLDIIYSGDWAQAEVDGLCVYVGVTPRKRGNIDIFGDVKYDENGKPVLSVLTQGAATYGKTVLLPLLKTVYDVEPGTDGYIDLVFVRENPLTVASGIYNIPKRISRGDKKDKEIQFIRRENIQIFPLAPKSLYDTAVSEGHGVEDGTDNSPESGAAMTGTVLEHEASAN